MTDQPRAQVPVVMLVIANAYRRCNMWNAHCGASFEWVGRAVSPYLGFVTGWLMIAGTLIGTFSPVVVLRPSILAVSGITPAGAWPDVVIATGVSVVMLLIAVAGIRLTARTQVTPGVIEYLILLPLAAAGFLAWVMAKTLQAAPPAQLRSLAGVGAVGLVLLGVARFGLRSPFFTLPLESDPPPR